MTRTQIQQIIVIVLLIIFGAVWASTRKAPVPGGSPSPAVTGPQPGAAPAHRPAEPAPVEEREPEGDLARDLFQLPANLLQKIRERERVLEEQARLQREQALQPPNAPAAPVGPPLELSSLELQGIFWGTGTPQAIINRKILSVGDTIEEAEVTAINEEGVTLSYGGQEVELKPSTEVRGGESRVH